ncbi:MAG: 50S ribosomal protein L4 [Fastidiosipilaceae bacterium]|jgi:large subunit ribosomal protein L4
MAILDVYNMEGAVTGQIELSDAVFGIEPNQAVMHQVVKVQLHNRHQGTASAKGRSAVRGGGRRPYRQKGTGRARHGSIRSPLWIGGGVTFGPIPGFYRKSVPQKVRRLALKSALSAKVAEGKLVVVEEFDLPEIKTKKFVEVLSKLPLENKTLIIESEGNKNLELSARNVRDVRLGRVNTLNVLDVLNHQNLVVTKAAAEKIQEVYA